MINWLYRVFVLVACPLLAYYQISADKNGIVVGLAVGVALILVALAVEQVSLITIVSGVLGASAGIILSKLVDYTVFQMGNEDFYVSWVKYSVLRYFAFAVLGMFVTVRKLLPEIDTLDKDVFTLAKRRGSDMKILDTSAIIDGRIADICETRFLTGTLVVPRFVLNELQTLADSEDGVTRARGRRGLDILARLKQAADTPVKIIDKEVPEVDSVDGKLVHLAKQLGGKVVTTDFNLNKVAALEGVICLNVNDLTTALKPVVLPGEHMPLFVMKEGKERDQGVGYLDDGTMVVVEEGRARIGKRIEVQVTSILQTSAGRMVFTKFKSEKQA